MREERRKFTRSSPDQRRDALIRATLALIAEQGIAAATVRTIAARAEVTPGLIRHYYQSKEDLIAAAYHQHMTALTEAAAEAAIGPTARARLSAFVAATFGPAVLNTGAVALWSGFLNAALHDPVLRGIHEQTYLAYRYDLQRLIGAALLEAGQPRGPAELRHMAIAANAVIDGLWLEGGALPDNFAPGELADIAHRTVFALIGLDLDQQEQDQ